MFITHNNQTFLTIIPVNETVGFKNGNITLLAPYTVECHLYFVFPFALLRNKVTDVQTRFNITA